MTKPTHAGPRADLLPSLRAVAAGLLRQRRALLFVAVGCGAAAVHWLVVVGLVGSAHWHPLRANVAGWLVAFVFSFAGHHRLTFGDRRAPWRRAVVRFFLVSAAGFCVNEAAYALALRGSSWRYDRLLLGVLVAVAVLTYWVSRRWAFIGNPAR